MGAELLDDLLAKLLEVLCMYACGCVGWRVGGYWIDGQSMRQVAWRSVARDEGRGEWKEVQDV